MMVVAVARPLLEVLSWVMNAGRTLTGVNCGSGEVAPEGCLDSGDLISGG